jgi:hypothetical protein
MEKEVLQRLDKMIMKHELLLATAGVRHGVVPAELTDQIGRLEAGLYALREGVHGFMKARECGLPLENFDSYVTSLESAANEAEKSLLEAIAKLEAIKNKRGAVQ